MKYEGIAAVAPPPSRVDGGLQHLMLGLLAFFLFSLPLVEAPKNFAAGLYLLAWVVRAVRSRDFGGRWNRFDTAFALVLVSALASGMAGYGGDLHGVFRVFLIGWAVSRAPLPVRAGLVLPLAACAGVVVAIVIAAVPFLDGTRHFLELPSVGHVNQSALYIAILAAAAFGWWLQGSHQGGRRRAALALAATVCGAALLAGGSRAAVGAAGVAAVLIAAGILAAGRDPRLLRLLARAGATVLVLAALVAALGTFAPDLSDRKLTLDGLVKSASTETRIRHWRVAVEGWRQHPWLGWGPDSFQQLKVDDICRWRAERGEACDREAYLQQKHAHSLYAATLVERGALGVLALAVLLGVWAASLLRSARTAARSWLWPASAAGLIIVAVAGTFNTTLRVEHGSLALLWFALWIAGHGRLRAAAA